MRIFYTKLNPFFGVGGVYLRANRNIAVYRLSNIESLRDLIIAHFKKYPLISQKSVDFYLWCKVIEIILNKEPLIKSGFLNILTYSASKGISKKILIFYPKIKPVLRHKVNLSLNLNPY
jgi:hypothetical protein